MSQGDADVQALEAAAVERAIVDLYNARRKMNRLGLYDQASDVAKVMADLEAVLNG